MSTTAPVPYRLTVDQYDRMVAAGLFHDSRIELIDGFLMAKAPKSPGHCFTNGAVRDALKTRLPLGWTSRQYQPVRIPGYDEPEPDVAIIRGSNDNYRHRHPTDTDVTLLVDVSDTSLPLACSKKRAVYAREGIPVYWFVNLADWQVELYTGPGPAGYQSCQDYRPGDLVPVVIGGQRCAPIAVDDILPRRPSERP